MPLNLYLFCICIFLFIYIVVVELCGGMQCMNGATCVTLPLIFPGIPEVQQCSCTEGFVGPDCSVEGGCHLRFSSTFTVMAVVCTLLRYILCD